MPYECHKPIFTTLFFFFFCFATRLHRKHGEAQYHHHHHYHQLLHHHNNTNSQTTKKTTAQFLHRMNTYTIFTVLAIHPTKTIYHVPRHPSLRPVFIFTRLRVVWCHFWFLSYICCPRLNPLNITLFMCQRTLPLSSGKITTGNTCVTGVSSAIVFTVKISYMESYVMAY